MKMRAYFIAIFGLVILAILFTRSERPRPLNTQASKNTTGDSFNENSADKPQLTTQNITNSIEVDLSAPKSNDLQQTILGKDRTYTESEIKAITQEEFTQILKEIELKLPSITEIRKLPDEALHHSPAPIIHAGREIGLIQQILDIHQGYETEALQFYDRCVANKESPTPVRALCLTNLITINNKNGVETPLKKYPQELIDLAKMIIDI